MAGSLRPLQPGASLTVATARPVADSADANELAVLAAVIGREEPLSLRAIARLAALPTCEVQTALDGLRRAGLVLRLNTLVDSYAARS